MKVIEDFLKVGASKLEVKIIKETSYSNKSPVIMLHEGLGSVALWKDFPEKLFKKLKRNIIIYSRIGMGNSSPLKKERPTSFMHTEASLYLKGIVEHYCEQEPLLFGHSDGASIAIIYAGLNLPLKALVVEAPHLIVEEVTIREINKVYESSKLSDLKKRLSKYHADVERAFNYWCDIWLSKEFKKWNIEEYIENIKVPLFAIQGKNDQYGTLKHITIIENKIKSSFDKLLIDNCMHSPHIEHSELILDRTASFFIKNLESGV